MAQYTYNPSVFEVKSIDQARRIIVTEEAGLGTDERWAVETPYVADLIHETINVRSSSVLLDYGCGIGRVARELISKFGCRIVGVDTSTAMRALAVDYAAGRLNLSNKTFEDVAADLPASSMRFTTPSGYTRRSATSARHNLRITTPGRRSNPRLDPVWPQGRTPIEGLWLPAKAT